jgi:hypothetical protein
MTVANSIKAQIAEAEFVIRAQMARITELEAEVECLKADNNSAHSTLKSIYADHTQPTGHRIKAAQAALPHEVPRLTSVSQLELSAEPEPEPLAEVVRRQRARQNLLEPPHRILPGGHQVVLLKGNGRNDGDDHS